MRLFALLEKNLDDLTRAVIYGKYQLIDESALKSLKIEV